MVKRQQIELPCSWLAVRNKRNIRPNDFSRNYGNWTEIVAKNWKEARNIEGSSVSTVTAGDLSINLSIKLSPSAIKF
jgi:hypothetical protein